MNVKEVQYQAGSVTAYGQLLTTDDSIKPGVLVYPDWIGRSEFALNAAKRLVGLGYHAFVVDMYGEAKQGSTREENMQLMSPLMEDRSQLLARAQAALECFRSQASSDKQKIAAIGFCFGGLCCFDLARAAADLRGVVSFHGLFTPPSLACHKPIAKVLALHGFDDPMATPDQAVAFGEEMNKLGADWQLHSYGQTMHAFTHPEANDRDFGIDYHETSTKRAWTACDHFLQEVL